MEGKRLKDKRLEGKHYSAKTNKAGLSRFVRFSIFLQIQTASAGFFDQPFKSSMPKTSVNSATVSAIPMTMK